MVLELITFFLLALVLAIKYGSVTWTMKLRQRLRDAEARCLRHREQLKHFQNERRIMEREEAGLMRQRQSLEEELYRLSGELEDLKRDNVDMVRDLLRKKARIDPALRGDVGIEGDNPPTGDFPAPEA